MANVKTHRGVEPQFGPTGKAIYERTYSRVMEDGSREQWLDTVTRVVDGNLGFVDSKYWEADEREKLIDLMFDFKIIPAGRHLWATGVPGRQFIMNCWHAGWTEDVTDHFYFTFDQLMQGGGVGANYSNQYLDQYPAIKHGVQVEIICDEDHPDYLEMSTAGHLSPKPSFWKSLRKKDDTFVVPDTREGWAEALSMLLHAFFNGREKLTFDVSSIRQRGSIIKGFGGTASGPGPLARLLVETAKLLSEREGTKMTSMDAMLIDHWIADCVVSGNVRRSARMSIKHWADHDIMEFLYCKADKKKHWTTNISVEIDDDFFAAFDVGDEHARAVYMATVTGMMTNGEPGFYNRSLAQVGETGEVSSTNPCGEVTLEAFEYCCLGHVNLDAFYNDFAGAKEAHRLMARFLLRATFSDIPDERSQEIGSRNRRIGVGHFGFQGWLNKQGVKYSDSHQNEYVRKTLRSFYQTVRESSRSYAFLLRIPEPVKVTTVAPTGTIAKMPGRTEGIHPILFKYFINNVRFSTVDPAQAASLKEFEAQGLHVEDCIYSPNTKVVSFVAKNGLLSEVAALGFDAEEIVEEASQISFADMLGVQAMYQKEYADNAVSFTINLPGTLMEDETTLPDMSLDEALKTLIEYLPSVKGTTIMVDGTRPQSPYIRLSKEAYYEMSGDTELLMDSIDENCSTGACPIK